MLSWANRDLANQFILNEIIFTVLSAVFDLELNPFISSTFSLSIVILTFGTQLIILNITNNRGMRRKRISMKTCCSAC